MKRQQIYDTFDNIRPDQAAKERMLKNILSQTSDYQPAGKDVPVKKYNKRRPLLVAAIVVMAIFMMGCAVVLLNLNDLRIAEETYTENAHYERDGTKVPAKEKSRTVTSLQGIVGSKNQLAAQEWYEFEQSYDPNYEKIENDYQRPEDYNGYPVFNDEMLQKVKAICEKYDLLPEGKLTMIQSHHPGIFLELTGLESLVKEGKAENVEYYGSALYACGNFDTSVEMEPLDRDFRWKHSVSFSMDYNDKAYFDTGRVHLDSDAKQWNYTLSDGTELLIVKVDNCAWVFCDREDAFLSVRINTLYYGGASEPEVMSDRDIELVTECIDFTLKPQKPDLTGVEAKLEAAEKVYREEQEQIRQAMPRENYFEHDSFADLMKFIAEHEDGFSNILRIEYAEFKENCDYAFVDVTGDGQDELVHGKDGKVIAIWKMENGKTHCISGSDNIYICEGGIWEQEVFRDGQPQYYYNWIDTNHESNEVCWVGYSTYHESWQYLDYAVDEFAKLISEEEAMEIIDSYVRLDLDWKPVSEFPMS